MKNSFATRRECIDKKKYDALKIGADEFVITKDASVDQKYACYFDLTINAQQPFFLNFASKLIFCLTK